MTHAWPGAWLPAFLPRHRRHNGSPELGQEPAALYHLRSMTEMTSPTDHPRRAEPRSRQASLLLGRVVKGAVVLFGLLLLSVVVFILVWLQGAIPAGESFEALRAAAERELVVGTDRAAIVLFFVEHGLEYEYREDHLAITRAYPLTTSHRPAFYASRERRFGVMRVAEITNVVVVLDEQDRLATLEVRPTAGGL